jgi:hypothetical protein
MTPFFAVLRVVKVLPHVQETVVSTYSGWMSGFMAVLLVDGGRRVPASEVNRYRLFQCA